MKKGTIPVSEVESLIAQWDWISNNEIGLQPDKLSSGSQKKAFWYCEKHKCTYSQIIRARFRGQIGCEKCKESQLENIGRERYIKDKPVLAETNPELAEEWVSCNSPRFTPFTTLAGSQTLVRWKCRKCGGEYEATIANRALNKSGCPYCSGQKTLPGFNDLQTVDPLLASEWSPKNKTSPTEVTAKSNKKVFWICKLGHDDYLSSVKQRSNGAGCPLCAKQTQTSFPEQAILFYVKKLFSDAINRYNLNGYEIDIYIPSLHIGIEYNGVFYHKAKKEYDKKKANAIASAGVQLFIIEEYEDKYPVAEDSQIDNTIFFNCNYSMQQLSLLVETVLNKLLPSNNLSVNCERDRMTINEQYVNGIISNSIAIKNPSLCIEWDTEKNGKIRPDFVPYGSNQKYYWICSKCGYSYQATPKSRIRGTGCPCCAGKKVISGVNDLLTLNPEVSEEWDYEKNGDLVPEKITPGTSKKVWWKCKKGHSWEASVNNRVFHNNGCPYCSGRQPIKGQNDLATTNPELLLEWDFEKNSVSPFEVKAKSNKVIWWRCNLNHSYQSPICNRTSGRGCPYCSNHRVLKGFNDLLTTNPDLSSEWDYDKNKTIQPTSVVEGSHQVVWWRCQKCNYTWQASISSRNSHTGCPKCHYKYWIKEVL